MNERQLLERISINPKVMVGKAVIKGTRLTVCPNKSCQIYVAMPESNQRVEFHSHVWVSALLASPTKRSSGNRLRRLRTRWHSGLQ